MSGEDEVFCQCTTIKKAMSIVLIITILEALFHLAVVCPLTWFTFTDSLILQLGIIIPLALLTIVRVFFQIIAFNNSLDFFKRERNVIVYSISVVVEWAIYLVWYFKLYRTIFYDCTVTEPVCHLESNMTFFAAVCFLYAYILIGVPVKVFLTYIQFKYH